MAVFEPQLDVTKSGQTVVFRHCEPSDVEAFLEFQPKIAIETTNTLQVVGMVPDPERIRQVWANDAASAVALRLGCFSGAKMVGQLSFFPEHQAPHPWTKHVGRFGMFVLREFWGEGIGRRLLEIMESHARAVGVTRIEAMVREKNERGLKLYSRMGFEIEGTRRKAALIDGQMHDEFFIAKILNEGSDWRPPSLETERLVLRPLEISDAPAIFEYAKNANVSRHTLWEPHTTLKDSESYILDYAIPYYRKNTPEPLGIALKSDPNKIIGTAGCFWVSKSAKSMELAYALAEPHWGKGIVAEASKTIVDHCFKEYELARLQARCKTENSASRRVMEKIGMTFEGTRRSETFHRGRHWDLHCYAILRRDWEASQNS